MNGKYICYANDKKANILITKDSLILRKTQPNFKKARP